MDKKCKCEFPGKEDTERILSVLRVLEYAFRYSLPGEGSDGAMAKLVELCRHFYDKGVQSMAGGTPRNVDLCPKFDDAKKAFSEKMCAECLMASGCRDAGLLSSCCGTKWLFTPAKEETGGA